MLVCAQIRRSSGRISSVIHKGSRRLAFLTSPSSRLLRAAYYYRYDTTNIAGSMDTVTTTTYGDLDRRQINGNAEENVIHSGGLHHSDNVDVARDDTLCVNPLAPAAIDKSTIDEVKSLSFFVGKANPFMFVSLWFLYQTHFHLCSDSSCAFLGNS